MAVGGDLVKQATGAFLGFNFWWVIWVLLIGAILFLIISMIRKKMVFIYPVRIFKTRENGSVKEINWKGGYIKRKNSGSYFRIMGRFPWQKINLNTTPNPKFIDQDNRVYYKQIDLGTYVQLERQFSKDIVEFIPVEQDVIFAAVLAIQKIDEVLNKKGNFERLIVPLGLTLMFIFGIIAFWFITNGKCPAVGG